MALLILMPNRDSSELEGALRRCEPQLDLRVWPQCGDPADIVFVVSWNHPPGELRRFPSLRAVASFGAGVDHMLGDHDFPCGVEVVRMIDDDLVRDMAEYVCCAVLSHRRSWLHYHDLARERRWRPSPYPRSSRVVVLGLGRLGRVAARRLHSFGLDVIGWSRSLKSIEGIKCIQGRPALESALAGADYVACLLPLTPETEGILDASLFACMKPGAYLINVGRGRHLIEADLLAALDQARLGGACLDVFVTEPLPADHPFWNHPRITITPHVASLTNQESVAAQILDSYRRAVEGRPLLNRVDLERGY
jgi:glyoxylate/hydroxypyruvate reductase A